MSEKRLKKQQIAPFVLMWIASGMLSVADWLVLRAAVSAVAAGTQEEHCHRNQQQAQDEANGGGRDAGRAEKAHAGG